MKEYEDYLRFTIAIVEYLKKRQCGFESGDVIAYVILEKGVFVVGCLAPKKLYALTEHIISLGEVKETLDLIERGL